MFELRSAGRPNRTAALAALAAAALFTAPAMAQGPTFLEGLHDEVAVASTIPANGDVNPYAVVVAPVSIGRIQQGDVLVGNFNDTHNLQGLGTTIVQYRSGGGRIALFASAPRHLAECPGGVGLTTAMTMLRSGYVIVGSMPSNDGTTTSKGPGCLIVFDANGAFVRTIVSKNINGPWSNIAVVDRGSSATLFVTNIGVDLQSPGQDPVKKANVLRIELALPANRPPVVRGEQIVADGFASQPDKDVFAIGPTGLALGKNGTLYVSDAIGNSVHAIPDALNSKDERGHGR